MRNICFLNMFGDITISWDKQDDKVMLELIQEKLDNGYSFFQVESSFFGLKKKTTKVDSIFDIKDRKFLIKDKDIEKVFEQVSSLNVVKNTESQYTVKKALNEASKIIKSNAVCVRPACGG